MLQLICDMKSLWRLRFMKMKCARCGSEENVSLWLKNYNDYACSQCSKNILGNAETSVRIFSGVLRLFLFIIALLSFLVFQNIGLTTTVALILAVAAYIIVNISLYPIGVRVLYKLFNKSK